jgi:rhodanese-related sulfurtransferase
MRVRPAIEYINRESEMTMKYLKNLIALTLALLTSLAFGQQAGNTAGAPVAQVYKTPKLSRAQVDALLANPGQVVFIDVRRPDELSKIGGFPVYLSVQSKDLEKALAYIPKDRSIVTVSNHAIRAFRSGDLLSDKGFKVAGAVGVQDYEAEGGTLTKVAPPAPRPETPAAR